MSFLSPNNDFQFDTSFKQLKTLIEVTVRLNEKKVDRIRPLYKLKESGFENTLELASLLKIILVKDDEISIDNNIISLLGDQDFNMETLKELTINSILDSNNLLIVDYLSKFYIVKDTLEFTPSPYENIKFSGIRNFLLEVDLIIYRPNHKSYCINPKYSKRYLEQYNKGILHPDDLKLLQENRERIGVIAEIAVLNFEKKRLNRYPELVKRIEHVASKNVLAGYDIKSWSINLEDKETVQARYIEVKALSHEENFYWSRNEINKAKDLGSSYFLYMLPVIKNEQFDIQNMKIISNPYDTIFKSELWDRVVENYLFKSNSR